MNAKKTIPVTCRLTIKITSPTGAVRYRRFTGQTDLEAILKAWVGLEKELGVLRKKNSARPTADEQKISRGNDAPGGTQERTEV